MYRSFASKPPPPPHTPYGVLWVARFDRQAHNLSKTKSSSAVPDALLSRENYVQYSVDVLTKVPGYGSLC